MMAGEMAKDRQYIHEQFVQPVGGVRLSVEQQRQYWLGMSPAKRREQLQKWTPEEQKAQAQAFERLERKGGERDD
jgi:hypothetical protein